MNTGSLVLPAGNTASVSAIADKFLTTPAIYPKRGQHVRPGDIVRPTPKWEHLDGPNRWREAFTLCFVAFYSVECAS